MRAAEMAGQAERPFDEAGFVAEPAKRFEACLGQIVAVEGDAADDQRVRQPRVVIGECVLEPVPVLGRVALVRLGELVEASLEQPQSLGLQPVLVEAGKSEDRIRAGAQGRVRSECADDLVEQSARGADDGGDPGRREDLAQRPDRAADVVPDVRRVEPAPVVAHEVSHPGLRVGRVLEEGERAVDDRRPDLLVAAAGELERDDREPRDVVDAVAALAVRDHAVGVLDDPDVVDEGEQMVGPDAHELWVQAGDRPAATWSQADGLLQDRGRRLGDRRPLNSPPILRASARAAASRFGSSI